MNLIYVGSDHRGFNIKNKIVDFLREKDYQVQDLGPVNYDKEDDYNEVAVNLGELVAKENSKGILICGSGIGMSMTVNKVKGVRGALCLSERQAVMAREDSDANVLCLAADLVSEETNLEIVEVFLETIFTSEERFIRRINKIKEYERT